MGTSKESQSQQAYSNETDCETLIAKLKKERNYLCGLEEALDNYMCSGKAELTEINKAATNINTSKSIILQLETEIAKCDPNSSDQKPGNDSQSILSSSVGRRKLAIETTPSL